jgi:response regulator of citrate/malate metabolism
VDNRLGEETRDDVAPVKESLFSKLRKFLNKDQESTPDVEEKPQMSADEVNAMLSQKPNLVNEKMLNAIDDPTLKAKIMAVLAKQKQQPAAATNTTVDNEGGQFDAYMK